MVYNNQTSAPDAEVVFRAWAINRTPITDICSQRVATRLPRNATLPFLVFFRGGGLPVSPRSQVLIEEAIIPISCYAGRWGGDATDANADYSTAYSLAAAVQQSAFNESNASITLSDDSKAFIYGFDIVEGISRIEETETGLGLYTITVGMTYRYDT
jgi:hypothetical protein